MREKSLGYSILNVLCEDGVAGGVNMNLRGTPAVKWLGFHTQNAVLHKAVIPCSAVSGSEVVSQKGETGTGQFFWLLVFHCDLSHA